MAAQPVNRPLENWRHESALGNVFEFFSFSLVHRPSWKQHRHVKRNPAPGKERRHSFVTNYVEVETHALILRKLGRALARQWLLTASLPIVRVSPSEENPARELISSYADKDWRLCDAISFAVIERRRVWAAFSFDRRFRRFGKCQILGQR